jgi:hypothetical protein
VHSDPILSNLPLGGYSKQSVSEMKSKPGQPYRSQAKAGHLGNDFLL